jgi:hypothetical protein
MKKTTLPRAARGRLYSVAAFVLVDCLLGVLAWFRWSRSGQPASAVLGVSEVVGVAILITVLVAFLATVRTGPKWISAPAARRATLLGRIVAALRMVGLIGALAVLATAGDGPDVSGLYLLTLGLVDAILAVAFTTAIASELPTPDGRAPKRRTPRRSKTPIKPKTTKNSENQESPETLENPPAPRKRAASAAPSRRRSKTT